jgi:3-dehydroquinate dehydratase-2
LPPRVFVLNGVNLGSLGHRRPEVYGTLTLNDIEKLLRNEFPTVEFEFRQTDHEGEMVGYIRGAGESMVDVPKVEVHLSNVHMREEWRRRSVVSPAVDAVVAGMGAFGYRAAVAYVLSRGEER